MNVTVTFNLTMLAIVGVNVLGILVYVAILKLRAHRLERAKKRIIETVSAYFAITGVTVMAEAMALPKFGHFIVIADAEPLKRLRHSHIVEMVLTEEIRKATGFIVERVFWRFPLPAREGAAVEAPDHVVAAPVGAASADPYLAQGLARLRVPDGLEVREDSWIHFQEALHAREEAQGDAGEAGSAPTTH